MQCIKHNRPVLPIHLNNVTNLLFCLADIYLEQTRRESKDRNCAFAFANIFFQKSDAHVWIVSSHIVVVCGYQIATDIFGFIGAVNRDIRQIIGRPIFIGWMIKCAHWIRSDATLGFGKQLDFHIGAQDVKLFFRRLAGRDIVLFIVKREKGGIKMPAKTGFHIFLYECV